MYAFAIESGWVQIPKGDVVAAFYFDVQTWDRGKGFAMDDESINLFPKKRGSCIDQDEYNSLMSEFESVLKSVTDSISSGRLWPSPENKESSCNQCDWRSLCRAPHLN